MTSDKEIKSVLSLGQKSVFSNDPAHKDAISKTTLELINKEAKRHLSARKKVHFILIKE